MSLYTDTPPHTLDMYNVYIVYKMSFGEIGKTDLADRDVQSQKQREEGDETIV